jgi:hypothetical protein
MPWLRHFALFLVFVTALFRPAAAGAFSSAPDAGSQARVGAFELVAATLVGPASGATCGLHEGIGAEYDENASGCRFAARGGLGPVRQGAAGVGRAVADLEAAGGRVLGREVTIEAGGVRTRPDLFVELPSGQQAFLEIKTGASAGLTPNQTAAFPQIWTQGGIPREANAAAAGLTPGVPIGLTPVWTVHYPWPLP